jgi:crotonobetainyl-CoA:carnitine CoA-transferase CaiB-like acyl-CoA transferase
VSSALDGIRVVELTHERTALAGKLLADMGAEVIVVEPPGGSPTRGYGPFAGDEPGAEQSLWWWHYNTSKRSLVLDLDTEDGAVDFRALVGSADVVLEAEPLGRLAGLSLDWEQLGAEVPGLVWTSITHEGRNGEDPPATDLTILAEGGPVWSCGYDDHTVPPVRGGGNQGLHTACHYAVAALLVALYWREESGDGQLVDVSMLAAANATTEFATLWWLNAGETVHRQSGRHANPTPTEPTQVRCRDGRYLNSGVPPRQAREFQALRAWIDELGLRDECSTYSLLELGDQYDLISIFQLEDDPLAAEVFQAGRDTILFLSERLGAQELFVGLQRIGLACGVIYSPEEMLADPHFVERGFPVEIDYDGERHVHPGAPYRFGATPWRATRAPRLGEHQHLLGELD